MTDRPELDYDLLEQRHVQGLTDAAATGRVYTPAPLAAFMANAALDAWAGDLAAIRVVDPACGCGALLVATAKALLARGLAPEMVAGRLHGADLDAEAVAIAAGRLRALLGVDLSLAVGDSLEPATLPGAYDVVIANPPYIRQERLTAATKAAMRRRWGHLLDGTADLAAAFYALGWDLLAPGGVHLYLGTDSWLDVAYAARLRRHLAMAGQLRAIWQLDEAAFDDADIHPVVSLAVKSPPAPDAVTAFRHLDLRRGSVERETGRAQAGLAREAHWAGPYLRAPAVYGRIVSAGVSRLVPLAELAELRRGWTTGANEFFYLRPVAVDGDRVTVQLADGETARLPAAALGPPVLVKAGQLAVPRWDPADLPHRLLRLNHELLDDEDVRAWLARAERLGYPQRPTLRSRAVWWAAEVRPPATLCLPIGHKRRPVLGWPNGGLVASDNFLEIRPYDADHTPVLAASLLSAFALLAYEAVGRANFGQGLLKTQVYELAELPVLDPRVVPPDEWVALMRNAGSLLARAPEIVYNEVRRSDRQGFEAAWLSAAGVELTVGELHEALCRTIWRRQSRADQSRESRLSYDDWHRSGQPF
ncbi:MAG: N-6 DNA methylase [Armatimonadetes bacterium]|nr:N-6 DNA methylase [Armatimonadota bacterium]